MITPEQYFGSKPYSEEQLHAALDMLRKVNAILHEAWVDGAYDKLVCPNTGSQVSGSKGGSGDGGFRLASSKTGAARSQHKAARAVDVYDPIRSLAKWLVKHKDRLAHHGLYCEDFRWTPTWCHFQSEQSRSGKLIYIPSALPPLADALDGQQPLPFVVKI